MTAQNRPQHYRIRRMVQMVRESAETGYLANSGDFMNEFEVSRRTVARDLDYLRDEENAPLSYDEARHGYVLTDPPSPSATAGHARPTRYRRSTLAARRPSASDWPGNYWPTTRAHRCIWT